LIEQQAATIERYTNLNVGRYLGRQKRNSKYYSELDAWREEFATHEVLRPSYAWIHKNGRN
jgi:hypothetical protein